MGEWGKGLYQNDIAADVKSLYEDELKKGKDNDEITKELITEFETTAQSSLYEDVFFWVILADMQWKYGRLKPEVKEKAFFYLQDEYMDVWLAMNPEAAMVRRRELCTIRTKLQKTMPQEKVIKKEKCYHCEWKTGDVFGYRMSEDAGDEYAGKYVYFIKCGETRWHPEHIIPEVYVYCGFYDRILSLEEVENLKYCPQFYTPNSYIRKKDAKVMCRLALISTSKRVIPNKRLTWIGNIECNYVEEEVDGCGNPTYYSRTWKCFEGYVI